MHTTRIMAGHYEVRTDEGTFKIDHECGLWFVVCPDGAVHHAPNYRGARKIIVNLGVYGTATRPTVR